MKGNTQTHSVHIGNSTFWVWGGDTETLKEVAKVMGLKYDKLEPSKISLSQTIIRVWGIGELQDYLEQKKIKSN